VPGNTAACLWEKRARERICVTPSSTRITPKIHSESNWILLPAYFFTSSYFNFLEVTVNGQEPIHFTRCSYYYSHSLFCHSFCHCWISSAIPFVTVGTLLSILLSLLDLFCHSFCHCWISSAIPSVTVGSLLPFLLSLLDLFCHSFCHCWISSVIPSVTVGSLLPFLLSLLDLFYQSFSYSSISSGHRTARKSKVPSCSDCTQFPTKQTACSFLILSNQRDRLP
jgi:hypothetical protein